MSTDDDMTPPPLDFSALHAEETPPLVSDFTPPDTKAGKNAGKRKWWQAKPKNTRPPRPMKAVPAMPKGGIAAPMAALYAKIGEFVATFDPGCGNALIAGAHDCGKAWENVAKNNPKVRAFLIWIMSANANSELLVAHLPIFGAVAVHHVPAVRTMMEKMAADAGEMFAKMAADSDWGEADTE